MYDIILEYVLKLSVIMSNVLTWVIVILPAN